MILNKSVLPFSRYSRLLQRGPGGTFRGYGEDWAPPDWNNPQTYQQPAPVTSTGVPYYLANTNSDAGGETVYVTPTPSDSRTGGGEGAASFFTNLFTGLSRSFQTPTVQSPYYQYPHPMPQPGIPTWVIALGAVVGAVGLAVALKK